MQGKQGGCKHLPHCMEVREISKCFNFAYWTLKSAGTVPSVLGVNIQIAN
jgi:hypothetical protein